MGKVTVLEETTKNPLTLMGKRAGVCWGADVTDDARNYKRGLDCLISGHGRVLEYVNVELVLDGIFRKGDPGMVYASGRFTDQGCRQVPDILIIKIFPILHRQRLQQTRRRRQNIRK